MAADSPPVKKHSISFKSFGQGLALGFIILIALAIWIQLFYSQNSYDAIHDRLASQTQIIDWRVADNEEPLIAPITTNKAETSEEVEGEKVYAPITTLESGLTKAPVDGLHKETAFGFKPTIRAKDGLSAFEAYRRPYDVKNIDKPLVAIAIAGLGLSDIATESAVRSMPPEISFIFSPYTETLDFWIKESRARGHEVWLTLPVEANHYPLDDPGPHTMLINAPERENQIKAEWLLSQSQGYIGFVTSYDPIFINSANDMRPIIGNIYNSGLAFVDGSKDPSLIPQTMAVGIKAPYSTVDIWLDKPNASQISIQRSLEELEQRALEKGFAVGVIHALPVSYQQLLKWIDTLAGKGILLVPLSATTGF